MAIQKQIILIDFDGTCTTHEYPLIGKDIGAVPVLKKLIKAGHKLILHTMRAEKEFKDAEDWFDVYGIPLYASNKNPTQHFWTKSKKIYAHLMIDDAALGCPLIYDKNISDRPYVDWVKVEALLKEHGVIEY